MLALVQRVTQASVEVDGVVAGAIGAGLLALVCAEPADTPAQAGKLVAKLLRLRIFADDAGRMNRSLQDIGGGLLLVPQFTLAADTKSGTRPSFTPAASPQDGLRLFNHFVEQARSRHASVQTGQFGADMQVSLTNDGPVTFWLQVDPKPQ